MRRRGDRVTITTGKYAGRTGTVDSNVFQKTADRPGESSSRAGCWGTGDCLA
ncbi:MAG: KOW motif-containing protein [Chloroflexi bacterium]|nr:KOW motif-containing protein [Chloroflexota bacterium]